MSVLDLGVVDENLFIDAEALQSFLDDESITELSFPPGEYRFKSRQREGDGNDKFYLWIRRSNIHIDLGDAVLRIEPEWPTETPSKTHTDRTDPPPPSDDPGPKPLWKETHVSVFLIGSRYERAIWNISLSGGWIAGYGEKVEWMPRPDNPLLPPPLLDIEEDPFVGLAPLKPYSGTGWVEPVHLLGRRADVMAIRVGHCLVSRLRIHGLRVSDVWNGISLVYAHDVEISNSSFSQCHRQAVTMTGVTKARIFGCSADKCSEALAKGADWLGFNREKIGSAAFHLEPDCDQLAGNIQVESTTASACETGFALKQGRSPEPVSEVSIKNCKAMNCRAVGIHLERVRNWSVSDCEVDQCAPGILIDNKCRGSEGSLGTVSGNSCLHSNGYGIGVISNNSKDTKEYRGANPAPLRVHIVDNRCDLSTASGILLSEAHDIVCESNTCCGNRKHGIQANQNQKSAPDSNLLLRGNWCVGNSGNGIDGLALRYAWLSNNTAGWSAGSYAGDATKGESKKTGYGIYLFKDENIWLANNETWQNAADGICMKWISSSWLTKNESTGNAKHGINLLKCTNATLAGSNTASGNGMKPEIKT